MMKTTERSSNYLYLLFAICFLGDVFGGVASTLMSAYLPVVSREFSGENSDQIGAFINAAYLFGMMFGGLGMGFFADYFGRKKSVLLSLFLIGLGMTLTAFSQNWTMIGSFRFLSGMGVGGALVSTATIISEEWAAKNRRVALGILSITIPVGIFSAGAITYFLSDWRGGFLVGFVPILLAILGFFLLKESENWMFEKSKKHTISNAFNAYTVENKSIFNKTYRNDLWLASLLYGSMLIGLWAIFAWLPTWVQTLVRTGDGQKERGLSMMLFAIGGLCGGFISGWVARFFGTKKTMLACFGATFLLTFLLFKMDSEIGILLWLKIGGIALFFGLSQGVLNSYVPELFPTSVRSSATGFCFNIGRIFTASVVFYIGWIEKSLGGYGNALFVFSFVFLVGLVATFFINNNSIQPEKI
jgi:MFS family permease